ncbi:MAG: RsmB/NOP family class I SAM-dependent RNA methyltransferase [Candidatus Gracilibacteria bacterium]|nr:RsmB/NOP family class I SAM-dependent RNA methyltransferase [Candidatus Gracilibacteria bacterium]
MNNKLPKELIDRLNEIYNKEEMEIIQAGFECDDRKTSFRVNTLKSNDREIIEVLKNIGLETKKVEFLKHGYILDNAVEKDLWELDIYKQGKIYVQSISSQIPVDLLDIRDFDKILDITAAPGGKTSQASAFLKNTGEIVAVDNNQIRIDKLNFTLKRQGCRNVAVIKSDAKLIGNKNEDFRGYFDHIIADLPCSAEGKININREKSYGFWSKGNINKNYYIQKDILNSVLPLLKNNGTLIYSTCTLAPEENEAVVHMLLSNYPELQIQEINLDYKYSKKGLAGFGKHVYRKDVSKTIRILPSVESEGFFVAKFKKIKKD